MFNDLSTSSAVALAGWSACGLRRQIGDVGGALEAGEALAGGDFVRIVPVSIDFAHKDAAVLVFGPLRALLSITAQKVGTRIGLWPR